MGKVIRRIIQIALVLLIVGAAGYIGHKEYQKRLLERVEAPITSEEFFPYNIPTTPSVDDVIKARTSINGFYGFIASENSEINSPIWRGLSDYALYRGGALWDRNMEFGKGHIVAFGHNVTDRYLFGQLSRLRSGSKVYMYQGSKVYVYEIYDSRSGWDNESEYVNKGIEGKETCTLVTCIGMYPTSARYFVKAKLVGVVEDGDSMQAIKDRYNWK